MTGGFQPPAPPPGSSTEKTCFACHFCLSEILLFSQLIYRGMVVFFSQKLLTVFIFIFLTCLTEILSLKFSSPQVGLTFLSPHQQPINYHSSGSIRAHHDWQISTIYSSFILYLFSNKICNQISRFSDLDPGPKQRSFTKKARILHILGFLWFSNFQDGGAVTKFTSNFLVYFGTRTNEILILASKRM